MKKTLFSLFFLITCSITVYSAETPQGQSQEKGWTFLPDINIILYPALLSSFYETPSAVSGFNNIIQGAFGTIFAEGSTDLRLLPMLTFHPALRLGWIMPNTMYLSTDKLTFLTIGGYVAGFNADLGFRPLNDKNYYVEFRGGFTMNVGQKLFFDYAEGGAVVHPGISGYYNFLMFGPELSLEGRWTFIPSIGLGLLASGSFSPSYENHSTVMNKDGEKSEFAPGNRWSAKVLLTWNNENILAALGWKYESIYFNSMDYAVNVTASHDLRIVYSGPIVQFTWLY